MHSTSFSTPQITGVLAGSTTSDRRQQSPSGAGDGGPTGVVLELSAQARGHLDESDQGRAEAVKARMAEIAAELSENLPGGKDDADLPGLESPLALESDERAAVEDLRRRDAAVKARSTAHIQAAGGFAQTNPSYTFETGPDGRRYAVDADIHISANAGGNSPDGLRQAAQRIRIAALGAVSGASGDDHAIAASAAEMEMRAAQASQPGETHIELPMAAELQTGIGTDPSRSGLSASKQIARYANGAAPTDFTT